MCDIADEAFEREQQLIQVALANREIPQPPSPECRNCGEQSQPGTSYCCAECREDDEKWQRAERQRRVA